MTSQRGCELFLVLNRTERERTREQERKQVRVHKYTQTHTDIHTSAKLLRDAYCRPKHTDVDYAIKSISRSRSFALLRFIFTPLQ